MKKKIKENRTNFCVIKKCMFYDFLFLFFLIIIVFVGIMSFVFFKKNINNYENRSAYYFTKPTVKTINSGEFQQSFELALSDQLLMSSKIKKIYNFSTNYINATFSKVILKDYCNNNYIKVTSALTTFGCEGNFVYDPVYLSDDNSSFSYRINNINNLINKSPIPVYTYYIEKDTDINFKNNEKTNISNYIHENY